MNQETTKELEKQQNRLLASSFIFALLVRFSFSDAIQKTVGALEEDPRLELLDVAFISDVKISGGRHLAGFNEVFNHSPPPKDGAFSARYRLEQIDSKEPCIPRGDGFPLW